MSAVTAGKVLTAEEFARLPNPIDGAKQELVRGEVITMPPPGFAHGNVQLAIGSILRAYSKQSRSGRVVVVSGVVTEEGPDTVRGPDVSYWSYARLPADQNPTGYLEVAPDLCVEVLSPGNTKPKMTRKIREYFAAGVRMVWVVDPEDRTAIVYRQPGDGRVLWDDATISGEDVLPDFSCPVADFFS